jgi:hypothetical protein
MQILLLLMPISYLVIFIFAVRRLKKNIGFYHNIFYFIDCWINKKVTRKEKIEFLRFFLTLFLSLILIVILTIVIFVYLTQVRS